DPGRCGAAARQRQGAVGAGVAGREYRGALDRVGRSRLQSWRTGASAPVFVPAIAPSPARGRGKARTACEGEGPAFRPAKVRVLLFAPRLWERLQPRAFARTFRWVWIVS